MLRSLGRITTALAEREHVGSAATTLQARRVGTSIMDDIAPANDKADAQLESFRGTIYAAVDKIGRRIAQLPVKLAQVKLQSDGTEEREEVFVHPFLSLLGRGSRRKPHEEYSRWELDYWTSVSLDLAGEAWWLVERNRLGVPARITPLPANRMVVAFSEETGLVSGYFFVPKGAFNTDDPRAIFVPKLTFEQLQQPKHLTTPFIVFYRYPSPAGFDDPRGWSPVKAAAYAYDINMFEQVYKRNFLTQGAQLGGILQSEIALDKHQIEEYLDQFASRHRGVSKAGLPIILPKMLKWHTTEPTPRDLQWVETMKVTREEILQIYGISDSKLGRADVGNRATADAQDVTFNREVIQSRLDLKQSKLDAEFLPIYVGQSDELYFDAEYPDPVPADNEFALKQEKQDIELNVRTRNELRVGRGYESYGPYGDMVIGKLTDRIIDPMAPLPDENEPPEPEEPEDDAALGEDEEEDEEERSFSSTQHARNVRDGDPDDVIRFILSNESNEHMLERLRTVIDAVIASSSTEALSLLADSSVVIDAEVLAVRWLDVLENRVRGINTTTADALRAIVADGITEGDSIAAMAKRMDAYFGDEAMGYRTMAIARTETIGATNYAAEETYRQGGAPYKGWLATPDERTRDTHFTANGQIVAINELFQVGKAGLAHPGDPNGPAEEVVNCRCAVLPEFEASRSAWDAETRAAVYRVFDEIMTSYEEQTRKAAQSAFNWQRQRVAEIMGRSS